MDNGILRTIKIYHERNVNAMKDWFCVLFGTIGSGLALLLGGWDANLITLLIFMAIDFALGIIVAACFKKSKKTKSGALSSKECFKGIVKKVATLVLVIIGVRVDIIFGADVFRNAIIIACCASECISIIENIALTGVPIPKVLTKAIELLKDKGGENENSQGVD